MSVCLSTGGSGIESEVGVLKSASDGVELDGEMRPTESLVRRGGLKRRSSGPIMAGPAKTPLV